MCGICGIINFDGASVNSELLLRMRDTLVHRGPDDYGTVLLSSKLTCKRSKPIEFKNLDDLSSQVFDHSIYNIGLGHRRLSIIDLSEKGRQPMCSEDSCVWISFNGEIYNFPEIRALLISRGHIFKSRTDSEVIIHAYEEWGIDCLQKLNGMFAFILVDLLNSLIYVVRDRIGIKPVFYCIDDDKLLVGSELKALWQDSSLMRKLDPIALKDYLTYGYVRSPRTILSRHSKLSPAHYLKLNLNTKELLIRRYWDIEESIRQIQYNDCENFVWESIRSSVKKRMQSDVPLGVFLSGGVDSTLVVKAMASLNKSKISTFTIGFNELAFDERKWAKAAAKRYNTQHSEKVASLVLFDFLDFINKAYDEPFADSSAIPFYLVSKLARESVKVVLSGDGGDELYAGYNSYGRQMQFYRKYNQYDKLFLTPLAARVFGILYDVWPPNSCGKSFLLRTSCRNACDRYNLLKASHFERFRKLLSRDLISQLERETATYPAYYNFKESVCDSASFLYEIQKADLLSYLHDDILTKVDRASMQCSLEVRTPLLDHRNVELALALPYKARFDKGKGKRVLRKILERDFRKEFFDRKKGFSLPLRNWFRNELKDIIHQTLISQNSSIVNFINKKSVENLIERDQYKRNDLSSTIWRLIVFEKWLSENSIDTF